MNLKKKLNIKKDLKHKTMQFENQQPFRKQKNMGNSNNNKFLQFDKNTIKNISGQSTQRSKRQQEDSESLKTRHSQLAK